MKLLCVGIVLLGVSCFAGADTFGSGANQFTIDFVPISGDAGDLGSWYAGSSYTFSGVNSGDYRMGTFQITNAQWDKFKANIDPMQVTGSPSSAYDSEPYWTGTNVPTNNVSWYEAAQFVNWLNIEAGKTAAYKFTGTQGTSDYTLGVWGATDAWGGTNLYRHKDAYYFLPTEDEWVKAAYWNGTSLQTYANASAGDLVSGSPDPAKWNYYYSAEPWNVGSGVQELNGTFDMMGNGWEWMESPYSPYHTGDYFSGDIRGVRGGSFSGSIFALSSSARYSSNPASEYDFHGFRVASIPEPFSLGLLFLGGVLIRCKRRR